MTPPLRPEGDDLGMGALALVDHHAHGVVTNDLDRASFELLISESGEPAPKGTSHFDTPVGVSIRRWCAPVLGIEANAPAEDYLLKRASLGAREANRRLLASAGLELLCLDTGHRPAEVAAPAEMEELAGVPVAEVVRIEAVAEAHAGESSGPGEWAAGLEEALGRAAESAVGLKTIVAYRHGLDLEVARPSRGELTAALDRWYEESAGAGGQFRLTSPAVLSEVLHAAVFLAASESLPLQVHAGFGDPDLTLHRADPSLFTPWVRECLARGVDVAFLHCYPYHRQAGYLAEAYPNVYFDVGCILNYAGPSARRILAEALELAPFTKMLYSSDAFGLSELVSLGAGQFRRHLGSILAELVGAGEIGAGDARAVVHQIGAGNARRIYPLFRADGKVAALAGHEREERQP